MKEYIEREAALACVCEDCSGQNGCNVPCADYVRIKTLQAADVVEVRHGRWMEVEVTNSEDIKTHLDIVSMWCNKCHRYHATIYYYGNPTGMMNYCPNCGAKMDGGADDE